MEELEPLPEYGDLMTIEEFLQSVVESGMFIDYDGFGHWATETHVLSKEDIRLSHVKGRKAFVLPKEATHIVWFNR